MTLDVVAAAGAVVPYQLTVQIPCEWTVLRPSFDVLEITIPVSKPDVLSTHGKSNVVEQRPIVAASAAVAPESLNRGIAEGVVPPSPVKTVATGLKVAVSVVVPMASAIVVDDD
jgi:hypothetical protein